MEAVTFLQICVETEKLAPVVKITRVENPESKIRLNMDLLCQDVFLYHYCNLHLPAPAISNSNIWDVQWRFAFFSHQEDSPRNGLIVAQRHLYYTLSDCVNTQLLQEKSFSPALALQAAKDFSPFAMCFKVKMLNILEGEIEIWRGLVSCCCCCFLVALQWCQMQQMQHVWGKKFLTGTTCALTRGKMPPEMKLLSTAVRAPRLLWWSCRQWQMIA